VQNGENESDDLVSCAVGNDLCQYQGMGKHITNAAFKSGKESVAWSRLLDLEGYFNEAKTTSDWEKSCVR
jgi:hypothetical protein